MNTISEGTAVNSILQEDMAAIYGALTEQEREKLRHSTIIITGCGGFLGYYFMHFFSHFSEELQLKRIIGLDNYCFRPQSIVDVNNLSSYSKGEVILHRIYPACQTT